MAFFPLENFFHNIKNLPQNNTVTMEKKSNGELAFLYTLLKPNKGTISVLVYAKPTHTDTPTLQLSPPKKFYGKCFLSSI